LHYLQFYGRKCNAFGNERGSLFRSRVPSPPQHFPPLLPPRLPTLTRPPQTKTHLHFILEFCEGGELYSLLNAQPNKRLKEHHVQFYAAEVLLSLQYLHLQGVIYR
jgi:serine/threonine protein kinase